MTIVLAPGHFVR